MRLKRVLRHHDYAFQHRRYAMKLINTRSLVAALGLSLLANGAWAQSATTATPPPASASAPTVIPATPPTPPASPKVTPAAGMPGHPHSMAAHHGQHGDMDMGHDHQAVIDKLGLSPAQKLQYDAAKTARKDVFKAKQANMAARQKAMTEQLSKDQMDPRAMIELNKQSRASMEAKRTDAEQKWLTFWDGLNAEQRKTFTAYMKSRQENHAHKHQGSPRG
jgi:hypothetical protein